jgi:hypothetical protein
MLVSDKRTEEDPMARRLTDTNTEGTRAAVLDMLRNAKAARDAAGRPDPRSDELLARAEAGETVTAGTEYTGSVSAGRVITGVKTSGGPITETQYTYDRTGGNPSGASSHRPARPMTGPQEGKIYVLLRQVPADVAAQARPWFEANKAGMTFALASRTIDRLKVHAANAPAPVDAPATATRSTLPPVPANGAWVAWRQLAAPLSELGNSTGARFAIPSATGNNDLDFWCIVRREGDRGTRFYLNRVIGGRPDIHTRMRAEDMVKVAQAIGVDPQAAMTRYGQELGHCGRCGRTLTDEESRGRGIGPDCWSKM